MNILKLRNNRIALKLTNGTYYVFKKTFNGYEKVRVYSQKEVSEMMLPKKTIGLRTKPVNDYSALSLLHLRNRLVRLEKIVQNLSLHQWGTRNPVFYNDDNTDRAFKELLTTLSKL